MYRIPLLLFARLMKKTLPLCVICNDIVHIAYCYCGNGGNGLDCKLHNDDGYFEGVYHRQCLPFLSLLRKYLFTKDLTQNEQNTDEGFYET